MVSGYVPGSSWLHRIGAGASYLVILLPCLAALVLRTWWAAGALVLVSLLILVSTGIPLRRAASVPWGFTVLLATLAVFQLLSADWHSMLVVVGTLLGCVWLSRALTLTTPVSDLMDALVRVTSPLDRLGFRSERFGLAVALMIRSIPWLGDSFTRVRMAARSRGLERHLIVQITPVVVSAVAFAEATGQALAARGLGDDDVTESLAAEPVR